LTPGGARLGIIEVYWLVENLKNILYYQLIGRYISIIRKIEKKYVVGTWIQISPLA